MHRRLFLTALAATMADPLRAVSNPESAAALAQPLAEPRLIDGLEITGEDGARVPLTDWLGRWVLLAIWSPWCLPCREEMPTLARLEQRLNREVMAVLPLAFDWRGPAWVRRFYQDHEIANLPVFMGSGENLDATVGVTALPSAVLINPAQEHVFTVTGTARWDDAETLHWLQELTA